MAWDRGLHPRCGDRRRGRARAAGVLATSLWSAFAALTPQIAEARPQALPPRPSQISAALPPQSRDAFLEVSVYALDPSDAAGPSLSVFTPEYGRATGAAVIIAPGGAYLGQAANLEGRQVADWFASRGVTAFVLRYRVLPDHGLADAADDGERAVRFVRTHAAELGVDPDRIGLMGFSAGGHLATMTVERADAGRAQADDPVERVSSRPDFLVLGYSAHYITRLGAEGRSPYCGLMTSVFGRDCVSEDHLPYQPGEAFLAAAPPVFLFHTANDELVPAGWAVELYEHLLKAGRDAELHVFARGPHGVGLGGRDPALSQWPALLEAWLRARGQLETPAAGGTDQ